MYFHILSATAFLSAICSASSISAHNEGSEDYELTRRAPPSLRCPPRGAPHIVIVSPGNQPPHANGGLQPLLDEIVYSIPKANNYSVPYPKYDLSPTQLPQTAAAGAKNTKRHIRRFVKHCPNTPIILISYSEGSLCAFNGLCGRSHIGTPYSKPFNKKYAKNLIAITGWGDPTFIVGKSWNVGSCPTQGVNPRGNPDGCDAFGNATQNTCAYGDSVCCSASGYNNNIHGQYSNYFTGTTLSFILFKYYGQYTPQPSELIGNFYYTGCFYGVALLNPTSTYDGAMTLNKCASTCSSYKFFSTGPPGTCYFPCGGNSQQICGAQQWSSIYFNSKKI